MKHPLSYQFQFQNDFPSQPFTAEEDFAILDFIRCSPNIRDALQYYSAPAKLIQLTRAPVFLPSRTHSEILKRLFEVSTMNENERDKIIERFAIEIVLDQHFSQLSQDQKSSKSSEPSFCPPPSTIYPLSEEILTEIDSIEDQALNLLKWNFSGSILAILRNENFQYFARNQAILIGRSSSKGPVDLDLVPFIPTGCKHVSRLQAILSYLDNFTFCLENIGSRAFRVNGTLLFPCSACILHPQSLLDFSGAIFIFFPNPGLPKPIN